MLFIKWLLAELSQAKAISLIIDRDPVIDAFHVPSTLLVICNHSVAHVLFCLSPAVLHLSRNVLLHLNDIAVACSTGLLLLLD